MEEKKEKNGSKQLYCCGFSNLRNIVRNKSQATPLVNLKRGMQLKTAGAPQQLRYLMHEQASWKAAANKQLSKTKKWFDM